MTSLPAGEPPAWLGEQLPRIQCVPEYTSTTGTEAIELCALAGLDLDPWEQWCLRHMLGERPDGSWAATTAGIVVPRQNGKGCILEARELVGLFLLHEPLILHTAHEANTSNDAFARLVKLVMGCRELRRQLPTGGRNTRGISRSNGKEGIRLANGCRVMFRTRTAGAGRGFTVHCLILDESMILPDAFLNAILPTLSAVPNPQVIYTGSAVDQQEHEHGMVLARLREQGISGQDPRLFYAEWSAVDSVDGVTDAMASDPALLAKANPSLGIRMSLDWLLGSERRRLSLRGYAVERMGAGDWPATTEEAAHLIPPADWRACIGTPTAGPSVIAFDVSPTTRSAAIARATRSSDRIHVEVVDHRPGTGWVVERLIELANTERPAKIVLDGGAPAGQLLPELEANYRSVTVTALGTTDLTRACGLFYDAILDHAVTHGDEDDLNAAVNDAKRRTVGQSWAWDRKKADISPLVAATLAFSVAKSLAGGVAVASFKSWSESLTPEAIAEKQKARDERVRQILEKAQGRQR